MALWATPNAGRFGWKAIRDIVATFTVCSVLAYVIVLAVRWVE